MKIGKIMVAMSLVLFAIALGIVAAEQFGFVTMPEQTLKEPVQTQAAPETEHPGQDTEPAASVPATEAAPETEQAGQDTEPAASVPATEASPEAKILRSDEVSVDMEFDWELAEKAQKYRAFGTWHKREKIRSVTFLDTLPTGRFMTKDVSAAGDGSVLAWTERNGKLYDLYIAAEGGVRANESCAQMFAGYVNLEEIRFGNAFFTDRTTDMSNMFYDCESLTELDLGCFDTGNVTDMSGMFCGCDGLKELDLSSFETGKVRDMREMFYCCFDLEMLQISSFDTGAVEDMSSMFQFCSGLEKLDVSSFDTGNVRNMADMFSYVDVTVLDLSGFDTGRVENMDAMFNGCTELKKLDLSSFDTTMVAEMQYMFCECSSLTELDLSSFDTANVEDMCSMFRGCTSLRELDLSHFVMDKVYQEYGNEEMFKNCPAGEDWQHLLK